MKELLADNMALHSQLEDLPAQAAVGARPHRLREIDSPLSWVFCFLGYVAVRTKDSETRNMLSYARLIVREAQCHGGIGWLEYDKWFRQQQAALTTQHPWNELNASLHAATVMSLRSGDSKLCKLCREPDHADSQCALASLQPPQPYAWPTTAGAAAGRRVTRPDTLERICTSWNKGRCAFPGSCRFRHVCLLQTQRSPGQRVRGDSCRLPIQDKCSTRQGEPRALSAASWQGVGSADLSTGLVAVVSQHRQLALLVFLPMIAVIGCSIIYQSIII